MAAIEQLRRDRPTAQTHRLTRVATEVAVAAGVGVVAVLVVGVGFVASGASVSLVAALIGLALAVPTMFAVGDTARRRRVQLAAPRMLSFPQQPEPTAKLVLRSGIWRLAGIAPASVLLLSDNGSDTGWFAAVLIGMLGGIAAGFTRQVLAIRRAEAVAGGPIYYRAARLRTDVFATSRPMGHDTVFYVQDALPETAAARPEPR